MSNITTGATNGENVAKMDRIRNRFSRVLNMPLTMDPGGNGFSTRLPGFKYDDFDRFGHIGLFKLGRFFEHFRYSQSGAFGFHEGNGAGVALGVDMRVSRALYRRAAIDFPVILSVQLTDVGRTSFVLKLSLTAVDNGEVVATRFLKLVMIDVMAGRRSIRLPERVSREWEEKLRKGGWRESYPDVGLVREVPPGAFRFMLDEVPLLDADLFNHTTQSCYIAYAVECAARAGAASAYRIVRPDLGEVTVARVSMVHERESYARDALHVHTWDDAQNPWVVHFVFEKDGAPICFAQFEYHEPTASQL